MSGGAYPRQPASFAPTALPLSEAEALAKRIIAVIDSRWQETLFEGKHGTSDRERIASDLEGLRMHFHNGGEPGLDGCMCGQRWPCPDAVRYADGLRRTAALYGVSS
jgi:hypothetical protein